MWPVFVVVVLPGINYLACVSQAGEPILIEALITESTVKGFNKSILDGFAWVDVVQVHAFVAGPFDHLLTSEL